METQLLGSERGAALFPPSFRVGLHPLQRSFASSGGCSRRLNYQSRASGHRAVTMLEVLLAMSLLVIVTSMTYWFYGSSLSVSRLGTEETIRQRVIRSWLERMAGEIRQATNKVPDGTPGIVGTSEGIQITSVRTPSRQVAGYRADNTLESSGEYDLVRTIYGVLRHPDYLHDDGYEQSLGLSQEVVYNPFRDVESTDDEAELLEGEIGAEEAREGGKASKTELTSDVPWQRVSAHEIRSVRFCYSDGSLWWDCWAARGENQLPQMVMITIGLSQEAPPDSEFSTEVQDDYCCCMNRQPPDCEPLPADRYSVIVRVPQAEETLFGTLLSQELSAECRCPD